MIPAENLVAAFQGNKKTIFAISKTFSEAQLFLEVYKSLHIYIYLNFFYDDNLSIFFVSTGTGSRAGRCCSKSRRYKTRYGAQGNLFSRVCFLAAKQRLLILLVIISRNILTKELT